MSDWQQQFQADLQLVEGYLVSCFQQELPQKRLFEAMRYSLLAGGKRIRPILTLAFCRLCGGDVTKALPLACAIEFVHTYSLIHDDLPCMDDDDLRRGRPTNHKVYGEACAVLAGDGLLTAAFGLITQAELPPATLCEAVMQLASAAGEEGMVGGQLLDMDGEGKPKTIQELFTLHQLKTGALIRAACMMGVLAAAGNSQQMDAAQSYGEGIGMAFQICDDVLDAVGDAEKLGKNTGTDAQANKYTFVDLLGIQECKKLAKQKTELAIAAIQGMGDSDFLEDLALSLLMRDH